LGVGAFGVRAVNSPLSSRCLECPGERHRVRFATEEAPAIRAKRGAQHIGYPFRAGSPTVERIKGLAERVTRTFCQRCRAEARSLDERVRAVANESFSSLAFASIYFKTVSAILPMNSWALFSLHSNSSALSFSY
jgi:hypothetical protein